MDKEESPAKDILEQIDLRALNIKLAADRTLMTWASMTLSMISFGFAIYEILQGQLEKGVPLPAENTPQNVGAFLIVTGTVGIVMGIVSYVRTLWRLRARHRFSLAQPPLVVALMMSGLGLFLCFTIAAHIF